MHFTGTGVQLIGPLGTNAGIARINIDGRKVATVDTYDPIGKQFQQLLFTDTHLRRGAHTPTAVVTGSKNPASSYDGIVIDAVNTTP